MLILLVCIEPEESFTADEAIGFIALSQSMSCGNH